MRFFMLLGLYNRGDLPLTLLGNNTTLGPLCYTHSPCRHSAQTLGEPHSAALVSQKRGKTVVTPLDDLVTYLCTC